MFSLGLLLLEMWALKKIFRETEKKDEERRVKSEEGSLMTEAGSRQPVLFPSGQFAVAALLMIAAIILSYTIDFREKVPSSRPLAQFPVQIAQWQGVRNTMEKIYLDELKFDDYVMLDYKDQIGRAHV